MTSDNQFRISRRKVLAGLGTIGIASAGAGLGTSAYFSDVETYENNVLTAGSLDLKVDWEEHYFHDAADEKDGVDIRRSIDSLTPEEQAMYVGFPDPDAPLVYIHTEDVAGFMDNTTLEAYPDADNDGIQDDLLEYDACTEFADTPSDLDPTSDNALRSNNEDTYDVDAEEVKPLVALDDVKPGDFGELTLSFHLCDNPGYVWMQGELLNNAENGVNEPESKDDQENDPFGPNSGDDMSGELAQTIQTMLWYDENGDNIYQSGGEGGPVAVQLVLDASSSMSGSRTAEAKTAAKTLAESVINANADNRVGVTFFSANGYSSGAQTQLSVGNSGSQVVSTVQNTIDTLPANGGSTAIGEGIQTADDDFQNDPDDLRHVMIVITDGQNNTGTSPSVAADDVTGSDADDYTDEIFAVGTGGATETSLETFARPVDDAHVAFAASPAELNQILGQIAQILVGEKVFFRGTLQELFDVLEQDHGIPLDGNRSTAYDEVVGGTVSDGTMEGRDCFVDSTTNMVGLAWWLPVDHANEIQSDSVSFNLGFYTEQCRHNDGSGQAPEPVTTTAQQA